MLPAQPLQGLIDGMTCLQAVLASETPVGCREIGRRCDVNRTRANRILGTWRHLGLLSQDEQAKYLPGPALHVLAGMGLQASGLLRASLAECELWWSKGYAVSLAVRWQDQISFLVQARAEQPFMDGIGRQHSASALRSSAGLAMLACADDSDLQQWDCATQWQGLGDGSDFSTLTADIREQSFATRSYNGGVRSLGISLDQHGQAALAISQKGLQRRSCVRLAQKLQDSSTAIHAALHEAAHAPLHDNSIPA